MKYLDLLLEWINKPIIHVSNLPITLGGIGTGMLVFIGFVVASFLIRRIIFKRLEKKVGLDPGISFSIRKIVHYTFLVVGAVLGVQIAGFDLSSLAIVFGFLSVGIGFGLQNITSNFISGIILLLERPITVGDWVTVDLSSGPTMGRVIRINMRATLIETFDNVSVIVPNSQFIESQVTNWSHGSPMVRVLIPVGVAYGSDLEKVTRLMVEAAQSHPKILNAPRKPYVRFLEFGDSSLNFELVAWTNHTDSRLSIRSDLNFAIDAAFRREGVTIPFPQRDLHLQLTPAIDKLSHT